MDGNVVKISRKFVGFLIASGFFAAEMIGEDTWLVTLTAYMGINVGEKAVKGWWNRKVNNVEK